MFLLLFLFTLNGQMYNLEALTFVMNGVDSSVEVELAGNLRETSNSNNWTTRTVGGQQLS